MAKQVNPGDKSAKPAGKPTGAGKPAPAKAEPQTWFQQHRSNVIFSATLVSLMLVLIAVFWNTLDMRGVMRFWTNPDGKYSHGWLVPLVSMFLLVIRTPQGREDIYRFVGRNNPPFFIFIALLIAGVVWSTLTCLKYAPLGPVKSSDRWWGLALLTAGLGFWVLMTYIPNETPAMMALVPSIAGVFLLVGGRQIIRWAGPPIAFLIFMYPLPGEIDLAVLGRLQSLASAATTFTLQTLGIAAYQEGRRIIVDGVPFEVIAACAGMRMATLVLALCVAWTMVVDRPWVEKLIIILSAVPIAIVANVIRIVVTVLLHLILPKSLLDSQFLTHDLEGYLMVPLSFGLLFVEYQLLSLLIVEEREAEPLRI